MREQVTRVAAMLLTADRPALTDRAVRSWARQHRPAGCELTLLIVDSGRTPYVPYQQFFELGAMILARVEGRPSLTIGGLRNLACEALRSVDFIAHWDSDDWSYPLRLKTQLADIVASRSEATGYKDMTFWNSTASESWIYSHGHPNYIVGTSLFYRRSAWEKNPFRETSQGEDTTFIRGLQCFARTSLPRHGEKFEPKMIADFHGGNTCSRIPPASTSQWTRTIACDYHVRRIMEES